MEHNLKLKTLFVIGTRPEAIKMAPLIKSFRSSSMISHKICMTGQHVQILDGILNFFDIIPDYNLSVMTPNQMLPELTTKILLGLTNLFKTWQPDIILTHGDTTTCLAASLAAYYHKIPIAHVEAGLRTGDIYSPWPEEANRILSDRLANMHFAPTQQAKLNLLREGFAASSIFVTGNTVIDALYETLNQLDQQPELELSIKQKFAFLNAGAKIILVTAHRRESFGDGFNSICNALAKIAKRFPEVDIVYPVHLNPNVQEPVNRHLKNIKNIHLIPPLDYLPFVYLMKLSHIILTDSGGIQEEAASLRKPVLVMREKTERTEALEAGAIHLVGTNEQTILKHVTELLSNNNDYQQMSQAIHAYGDGNASKRILNIVLERFSPVALTERAHII